MSYNGRDFREQPPTRKRSHPVFTVTISVTITLSLVITAWFIFENRLSANGVSPTPTPGITATNPPTIIPTQPPDKGNPQEIIVPTGSSQQVLVGDCVDTWQFANIHAQYSVIFDYDAWKRVKITETGSVDGKATIYRNSPCSSTP